tara:strand:- start:467465 stop:467974 length:510 start_codon:yes stop_codon:yes gene_type:complete
MPFAGYFTLLIATMGIVGCEQASETGKNATADSSFVLSTEPSGAKTPTEAMESNTEMGPIVLVGRVDAGDHEPFEAGQASFMLSELPDQDHAAGDPEHADNCPFCKRKLEKAPKVVVKILDSDGNVLATDARELLGIEKGDVVVVRGTGKYSDTVNLVEINANGVFRRS